MAQFLLRLRFPPTSTCDNVLFHGPHSNDFTKCILFIKSRLSLQRLEAALDYETTVLFRSIAAAAVRVELRGECAVALRKPKPGLFSRLFASDDNDAAAPAITLSTEQLAVRQEARENTIWARPLSLPHL
jgi:hypothetical protein